MNKEKAFRAFASGGFSRTAPTARQAALDFFSHFPNKRKCSVQQGETDGDFFVVTYSNRYAGGLPQFFKGVTKRSASELPDETTTSTQE